MCAGAQPARGGGRFGRVGLHSPATGATWRDLDCRGCARPRGRTIRSCLGVLAGVPGAVPRSGPADQAPTVTRRAVHGRRLSSVGVRRSIWCSRHRWRVAKYALKPESLPPGCCRREWRKSAGPGAQLLEPIRRGTRIPLAGRPHPHESASHGAGMLQGSSKPVGLGPPAVPAAAQRGLPARHVLHRSQRWRPRAARSDRPPGFILPRRIGARWATRGRIRPPMKQRQGPLGCPRGCRGPSSMRSSACAGTCPSRRTASRD